MNTLLFAISGLLISMTSFAANLQGIYDPVPDDQVLDLLTPPPAGPEQNLEQKISVLVWNTHKGKAGSAWARDLAALSANRQLVLLQEGMKDGFMPEALGSISHLGWLMAQNFYTQDRGSETTGVITGQTQSPRSASFLRSRDSEPVINTGKVSLFTTYSFQDGSQLMVINIHAINFVGLSPFYRQIDDIAELIANWKDKVIFAGDFNTWASERTKYLKKKMSTLGLGEVTFAQDPRGLILDHIFVRGCAVLDSHVYGDISTSDHKPMTADFDCGGQ